MPFPDNAEINNHFPSFEPISFKLFQAKGKSVRHAITILVAANSLAENAINPLFINKKELPQIKARKISKKICVTLLDREMFTLFESAKLLYYVKCNAQI